MDAKLGTNNDVTKDAKQYAIQDEKLGANKGILKDTKYMQKWMLKKMEKRCNRWLSFTIIGKKITLKYDVESNFFVVHVNLIHNNMKHTYGLPQLKFNYLHLLNVLSFFELLLPIFLNS